MVLLRKPLNKETTCNLTSHVSLFHDGGPYHIETSPLICSVKYKIPYHFSNLPNLSLINRKVFTYCERFRFHKISIKIGVDCFHAEGVSS